MTLSLRLASVASLVDPGAAIADVGSDHAALPLALLAEGKIVFAQAIENKKAPFERMRKAIEESSFASLCLLSLSDGISELDERVDTVVLAGMGGRLAARILKEGQTRLTHVRSIIADAHSDRPLLIAALGELGFPLTDEIFIYDKGIPYDIMKGHRDGKATVYTEAELLFGPLHLRRKEEPWVKHWRAERDRLKELLAKEKLPPGIRQEYEKEIKLIEENVR